MEALLVSEPEGVKKQAASALNLTEDSD